MRYEMWLSLERLPDGTYEWVQEERVVWATIWDIPANIYVLKQALYSFNGQSTETYEIQIALTHSNVLMDRALDELQRAIEFCSFFGGRYT